MEQAFVLCYNVKTCKPQEEKKGKESQAADPGPQNLEDLRHRV